MVTEQLRAGVRPSIAVERPTPTPAAAGQPLGRVLSVSGAQASVRLSVDPSNGTDVARATVGKFLGIRTGQSLVIGVITKICIDPPANGAQARHATGQVDLLGEIKEIGADTHFQRGVTEYPTIGDTADLITNRELRLIYEISGPDTIDIGQLQQDTSIGAYINVDHMVRKHFAILGTTGVGKSSGVALILHQIQETRPDLRLFLIDPHNEYARCFDDRAQVLAPSSLKLPFWLFNFE